MKESTVTIEIDLEKYIRREVGFSISDITETYSGEKRYPRENEIVESALKDKKLHDFIKKDLEKEALAFLYDREGASSSNHIDKFIKKHPLYKDVLKFRNEREKKQEDEHTIKEIKKFKKLIESQGFKIVSNNSKSKKTERW